LRTRHFFERGQILDELIDAQRFAGKFFNVSLHFDSVTPKIPFPRSVWKNFPVDESIVKFLEWFAVVISASVQNVFGSVEKVLVLFLVMYK
jgi:hypothetical protein